MPEKLESRLLQSIYRQLQITSKYSNTWEPVLPINHYKTKYTFFAYNQQENQIMLSCLKHIKAQLDHEGFEVTFKQEIFSDRVLITHLDHSLHLLKRPTKFSLKITGLKSDLLRIQTLLNIPPDPELETFLFKP